MSGQRSATIGLRKSMSWLVFSLVLAVAAPGSAAARFQYDSHGKRNPFLPASEIASRTQEFGFGELELQGIIVDSAGAYAMINGEIVQAGDLFSGFAVRAVRPNQVELEKDGEHFTMVLREEEQEALNQLVSEQAKAAPRP